MADNKKSPAGVKFRGGKPTFGGKGGKNFNSDNRGKRFDNDKPAYDGKKSFGGKRFDNGDKPAYEGKKSFGGKRYDNDRQDKPGYDGKKAYGRRFDDERPAYDRRDNRARRYDDERPAYDRDNRRDERNEASFRETEKRNIGVEAQREDELPFIIMGRNAVREAIKSGRSIDKILVIPERDGSLGEIVSMARDRNILIQEERREKLDEICMPFGHGEKTGNHQGIVARVPGADYVDIDDILDYARERGEKPFILLLDGITDPYNFGSIIRSAECAGVHGIIIPKRRSATLTSSAVKVSAGAASHMRIAKVPNIAVAIDRLKEENIFIAGTDMEGEPMYKTDLRGAMGLVIGSEDEGLSALVAKKCDFIVSAPIKGHIDSLNAGVAAAVIMYEKVRQDLN